MVLKISRISPLLTITDLKMNVLLWHRPNIMENCSPWPQCVCWRQASRHICILGESHSRTKRAFGFSRERTSNWGVCYVLKCIRASLLNHQKPIFRKWNSFCLFEKFENRNLKHFFLDYKVCQNYTVYRFSIIASTFWTHCNSTMSLFMVQNMVYHQSEAGLGLYYEKILEVGSKNPCPKLSDRNAKWLVMWSLET